jgi:hypothetical protein
VLSLPPSVRVFVCTAPTDMRKSFDALAALVQSVLKEDPFSGHLFTFLNRRKDKVKILYWDRSGFLLVYNQPSSHYTSCNSIGGFYHSVFAVLMVAARSRSRSHRLQCLAGRFGSGTSYRYACAL